MLRILAASAMVACGAFGATLHLRMETPLTSYGSSAGDRFRTVVIAPYEVDGRVLLPPGTIVYGAVSRAKAVHMGVVRERATMALAFDSYKLPDGRKFSLSAHLVRVDNARETVSSTGEIRGILAANSPQSLVGGLWFSPMKPQLFSRSFIGLTGAGGRLVEEYSMGPLGAAGVFALRCALFKLPEPEIRFPAGTELKAAVTAMPPDAPTFDPEPETPVAPILAAWLEQQPVAVTHPAGTVVGDIINLAFSGSREDIAQAFAKAGWVEAEPLNRSSLSRAYRAYSGQSGFAAAPVSKLLYRNSDPDLVFEKSLNTLSKRHHIRIWQAGDDIWLAAATHDVRVAFENGSITHRIAPRLDHERAKVANDLAFAGCAGPAGYVDRPGVARTATRPGTVETDGRLAVIAVRRDCSKGPDPATMELPDPPRSRAARLVRRMILEGRQYALRGHPYYWGYRLVTMNRARRNQVGLDE